jgi:hypothetical protein
MLLPLMTPQIHLPLMALLSASLMLPPSGATSALPPGVRPWCD